MATSIEKNTEMQSTIHQTIRKRVSQFYMQYETTSEPLFRCQTWKPSVTLGKFRFSSFAPTDMNILLQTGMNWN